MKITKVSFAHLKLRFSFSTQHSLSLHTSPISSSYNKLNESLSAEPRKKNMPTISSILTTTNILLSSHPSTSTHPSKFSYFPSLHPPLFSKSLSCPYPLCKFLRNPKRIISLKSSEAEEISSTEDEWLQRLPDKKKPLYSHSLPCIEAWLKDLGFYQSKEDRAIWFIEKPDWHAQLSLDVTDLFIRYLKNGPGNLEKDMERRFSYALSREDIENAILGGP